MRRRFQALGPILGGLGGLLWIFGFLLLIPLAPMAIYARLGRPEVSALSFVLPALLSMGLGALLKRRRSFEGIDQRGALLLCGLGWLVVSAVGALPFTLGLGTSYLDAYFETVSGLTTTGITMLEGLDTTPRSIIFWRALIQWIGGLGILTFFLTVVTSGTSAHRLFSAESHKIFSKRPAPSVFRTLQILWAIYVLITVISIGALVLAGSSLFDATAHTFTALSTGGYSPYDASIAYYEQAGFAHAAAIEYILIVVMILGGMNFFIHFRVLTGSVKALWDNLEMRLWWGIIVGATGLVLLDHALAHGLQDVEGAVRHSLFQVVSVVTTTGFATQDIGSNVYPPLAKQIFLVLMVVGGCVGSTGGGIKVLRVGVLFKMLARHVRRLIYGPRLAYPLLVDGDRVDPEEVHRVAALFFAWMVLLAFGAGVTALLSDQGALESASGMFSALGNIGPCYISVGDMVRIHPLVKVVYIFGMLAGRLEILPLLLLFSPRSWT